MLFNERECSQIMRCPSPCMFTEFPDIYLVWNGEIALIE